MSKANGLPALYVPRMLRSLAGLALLPFFVLVAPAQAADVTYWACHGPAGTPLGTTGITVTGPSSGGCDAPGTALSATSLRMTAPADLVWVSLNRTAKGPGYTASAGTELERADDGEELTGTAGSSASGRELVLSGGTFALKSAALTGRDSTRPTITSVTFPNRATGTLTIPVTAQDAGVGLEQVVATLDGEPVASAAFGVCAELSPDDLTIDRALGADCPAEGTKTLTIDTTKYANGKHELELQVTDAAGNTSSFPSLDITFDNAVDPEPTVTPEETATPSPTPVVQQPHDRPAPTPTPTPMPLGEIGILGDEATNFTSRDFLSLPARPRVSKTGTLTFTARCPLTKTCSLRVNLTRSGKTLGSGRVTVKPKKTAKLTLKLTKAARASLKKKAPQDMRLTVAGYAGVVIKVR